MPKMRNYEKIGRTVSMYLWKKNLILNIKKN